MKKFLFGVISLVLIFSLVACDNKGKNHQVPTESNNSSNSAVTNPNIARLETDAEGKPFIKLSDTYYFDSYKEMEKREILPAKIYLMDDNKEVFVSKSNGNITISLPIEKCDTFEEERIEYAELGIEKMLHSGIIKVGGIELEGIKPDIPEDGYD